MFCCAIPLCCPQAKTSKKPSSVTLHRKNIGTLRQVVSILQFCKCCESDTGMTQSTAGQTRFYFSFPMTNILFYFILILC